MKRGLRARKCINTKQCLAIVPRYTQTGCVIGLDGAYIRVNSLGNIL